MKKVLCVGYRDWAIEIYEKLRGDLEGFTFAIVKSQSELDEFDLLDFRPDIILFYGWSSIIPNEIIDKYKCLMLHPSALPKFRGGSPIQNQIINGVLISKVTIFRMTSELDAGDILASGELDLTGSLYEIFKRIVNIGLKTTKEVLLNNPKGLPQIHNQASYFKRRTPEQSEITIDEILNNDSIYLYNKVRMLADPYPNAFIRTKDGKKLLIKNVEIE
jgi:methionyl-tRNA formyltransferase